MFEKLFSNRKTKKQLMKEIEDLQNEVNKLTIKSLKISKVQTISYDIRSFTSEMLFSREEYLELTKIYSEDELILWVKKKLFSNLSNMDDLLNLLILFKDHDIKTDSIKYLLKISIVNE